ncbi:MAG TPA: CHAT domain-containing tetratricopeptide repeat protein [Myxococcales bacterium]|nr:CHAT domain-containing tetratricopeptide repeat protein [Myxococcales bacterium]
MQVRFLLLFLVLSFGAAAQSLDAARALQQKGDLREARKAYEALLPQLRGNDLASALNSLSLIAASEGDYETSGSRAAEALALFRALGDAAGETRALNNSGTARWYRADYPAALRDYEAALTIAQQHGNGDSEVEELNNIGSVHFFQAHYLEALRAYRKAMERIEANAKEPWAARKRGLTVANLAALFQRLGQEQQALELYETLRKDSKEMLLSEQAQLLTNQGVLYRRLEDPQKALATYRAASALLSREENQDGQIRVLSNIGIVQALDLKDPSAARGSFSDALALATKTGNKREAMQAHLYLGETLALLEDPAAAVELTAALAAAKELGAADEQWKALYGLGKLAATPGEAAARFREAVAVIESTRAQLRLASLSTDFLADKRDVYDALIGLTLPAGDPATLFGLLERSRARNFQDKLAQTPPSLQAVQERLGRDTLLLEFWVGRDGKAAVLSISSKEARAVALEAPALDELLQKLSQATDDEWKQLAASVGDSLMKVPLEGFSQLIIVADGPLYRLPFEVLAPGGGPPLVERFAISYLPSAALLLREPPKARWSWPWDRQLLAFADPRIGGGQERKAADLVGGPELRELLPGSAEEARAIAKSCRGRAELHAGADDLKKYLLASPDVPLLHLATHATADLTNGERSRILFSPAAPGDRADYLFLKEVYGLDLHRVDLATLSACDTERGKSVRGEGVQSFSRALLAAGARSSVTSLWRVADEPARELMEQLYYELNRGTPKAEALRRAKLSFLHSDSSLRQPRFWAPFVLSGDGQRAIPHVLPWTYLAAAAAAMVAALLLLLLRRKEE